MASPGQKLTYRIGRRTGKTTFASPRKEPGWGRKICYWNKLSPSCIWGSPHREQPSKWPSWDTIRNPCKASRQKWSRGEYKEVMEAFYAASLNPKTSITQGTYDIWRANNPTKRINLNASKLANQPAQGEAKRWEFHTLWDRWECNTRGATRK